MCTRNQGRIKGRRSRAFGTSSASLDNPPILAICSATLPPYFVDVPVKQKLEKSSASTWRVPVGQIAFIRLYLEILLDFLTSSDKHDCGDDY